MNSASKGPQKDICSGYSISEILRAVRRVAKLCPFGKKLKLNVPEEVRHSMKWF